MNSRQLQQEVLSCIWSKDLKKHIEDTDYRFTESELLGIAYHFAPNQDRRVQLLRLLADHAPSVSAHAARCAAFLEKSLLLFCQHGPDEIYELQISEDGGEDRYLCDSYETALQRIDAYRKEYDFAEENESTRYTVQKRKILHTGPGFEEDDLGECIFAAGKVLLSVDRPAGQSENGVCTGSCANCPDPCVLDMEVCFPDCIPDRSPVRYRLPDGSIHYGVNLSFGHCEPTEALYILPLDDKTHVDGSCDELWMLQWHEHIPGPEAELAPLDSLPEEAKKNYRTIIQYLNQTK